MEFDKWKVNALKTELFADKKQDSTVDPVGRIKSQLNQLGLG